MRFQKNHKRLNLISVIFLMVFTAGQLQAKDFISDLMKEGVATFFDAAKLIYYSFNPVDYYHNRKSEKERKNKVESENLTEAELREFLIERDIDLPASDQPITRKQFAKTVMVRFELPTGILTSIFGTENMYFSDAIKLGLFSGSSYGDENITTRELLSIFLKAEKLADNN